MLPSKVFQINYQDFAYLVFKDIEVIKEYEKNKGKFDFVLGKMRNGTFPASIIANELQISMGVIEAPRHIEFSDYRIFLPYDSLEQKKYNVLLVDGLCGTGESLEKMKKALNKQYPLLNIITYCPITDIMARYKADLLGLEVSEFIQPPWELRSFTPQSHLDRLENYDIKASEEKENCIGFSTFKIQKEVETFLDYSFFWNLNFEKEFQKITSTSGISTLDTDHINDCDLSELKIKYGNILKTKEQFIKQNGITHFFESNLKQAILLSELCPVAKILYFENGLIYKIQGFKLKLED